MMMTGIIGQMMTPPRLDSLVAAAAQAVMAVRIDVICRRRGIDPVPALVQRLGSAAMARRATHFVDVIGAAWPEPFTLSPPCCRTLSHDELLLGTMIEAAGLDDRRWFDRVCCDLLDDDSRDAAWRGIMLFASGKISLRGT